ncbi:MAG TPA: PA2169 family four-helix-bundle protein [Acidobacteriaceae bacterium]
MDSTRHEGSTSHKVQELESTLRSLIGVLEDSQRGMAEIGERLKDQTLRRYFLMESLRRANFRGELENILHQHGVADVRESGTAVGAVYRAWAELKAALGVGDEAMLKTAEESEAEALDAYRIALNVELPVPVRQKVAEQRTHILIAHEYLQEQRAGFRAA